MRIALGIDGNDTTEQISEYVHAGADEFFAGYTPSAWFNCYGWEIALNRREFGKEVQYVDLNVLCAASERIHKLGCTLWITFNAHYYRNEQISLLHQAVEEAEKANPDGYIVAAPSLLLLFRKWGIRKPVHLSTGTACFNSASVRYFCDIANVKRVIAPRKMTLSELQTLITRTSDLNIEYEVMIMGGRCFFNDEYCFTWHSGTDSTFCSDFKEHSQTSACPRFPADWKQRLETIVADRDAASVLAKGSPLDNFIRQYIEGIQSFKNKNNTESGQKPSNSMSYILASQRYFACGLCAIRQLREMGVHAVKIPGRGTGHKGIRTKAVKTVVDHPDPTPEFCRDVNGSSVFCNTTGSCYYALEAPQRKDG